jgi:cell division protein FtsQ
MALTSRFLAVQHIAVGGNSRLSSGEIEALVQGMPGQNIFQVDLDRYRQRVMDSPWVAAAALRRVLPATVEVRIAERSPMAIARVDGRLYLVDSEGVVIDEFGPEYREFDLPVVDGLIRNGSGGPRVEPGRAFLAHSFLSAIQPAQTLRQHVSQFDVSNDRDVVVLLDDDPTLIHVGDTRFAERLQTYLDLVPALQERLSDIDYVDMRFDDRVYVRSKTATAAKPARKR